MHLYYIPLQKVSVNKVEDITITKIHKYLVGYMEAVLKIAEIWGEPTIYSPHCIALYVIIIT